MVRVVQAATDLPRNSKAGWRNEGWRPGLVLFSAFFFCGRDRLLRMSLQTTIDRVKTDTAALTFTGNLTLGLNLSTVDTQIQKLVEEGVCWMVFDLTAVPYIDSAGLGVLVHSAGLARQKKGSVRLCGVSERVNALLKLTMMDAQLPVDADASASLAAMGSSPA